MPRFGKARSTFIEAIKKLGLPSLIRQHTVKELMLSNLMIEKRLSRYEDIDARKRLDAARKQLAKEIIKKFP